MSTKVVTRSRNAVDSAEPTSPPTSPKSPLQKRAEAAMDHMRSHSSGSHNPLLSPERPSTRRLVTDLTQESPRRAALAAMLAIQNMGSPLQARMGKMLPQLGNTPSFPITVKDAPSSKPEVKAVAEKGPCTRSQTREVERQELSDLMDGLRNSFWECSKANTSKKTVSFKEFEPAYHCFKDLMISLESKEFLDQYIVRDSFVGANKDPKHQELFDAFTAKILALKTELGKIGIDSLEKSKSVNFWSGREGQKRAADDPVSFSDSDIPLLKFLFDCWGFIKNRESMKDHPRLFLTSMLPNLFSTIFASFAHGEVNVYMSSKNDPTATSSVINIDSAFWSAELYHLTNNERVHSVNLYLHMGKDEEGNDKWSAPIDLKSEDPAVMAYKREIIHISKRNTSLEVSMADIQNIGTQWRQKAVEHSLLAGSDC